ncbi:energy-coupling factor transporter transmembrane component T family protein [Isoptericola rhizosphaerae]|uniref:energy-coupling factor transporter transmembrane component T family protein n=1 Tax=Isoptericola rhizosphaerae TaxID=3377837 RepID=UPI00383BD285
MTSVVTTPPRTTGADGRRDPRTTGRKNSSRSGFDRVTVEWVKLELVRVAYATRGGFLARRDPRAVLGWYLVCALAPWLTYSTPALAVFFVLSLACALAARIGPLLLGLFSLGLLGQAAYVLVLVLVLGGSPAAVDGLVQISLKLGAISLVSMAAFVSLDPEKLSDGLQALRAPAVLGFGVSYGYRMVPMLIDEFQTIVDGHRMRGAPHCGHGFLGWRTAARVGRIAVQAFYPLILNTAQRTRTTVEALETRGFSLTGSDDPGRRLRLAHLRFTVADAALLLVTLTIVVVTLAVL